MTDIEKTEAIKIKAETELPPLILAAGLDPFDRFDNKPPAEVKNKEFCVYVDAGSDSTDELIFNAFIHVQLFRSNDVDAYHSVIWDWLRAEVGAEVVDMTIRESVKHENFPMDNESTSFVFYMLSFSDQLDDC